MWQFSLLLAANVFEVVQPMRCALHSSNRHPWQPDGSMDALALLYAPGPRTSKHCTVLTQH